jgi:hypothetical protein
MDTLEKKIEEKIRKNFSHIKPSRSLFEDTMNKFVTTRLIDRSNKEKASVLSFYKLINNFIMISKKNILIGIPVAVFVIIAILFTRNSKEDISQIAINSEPSIEEKEIMSNNNLLDEDLSSIDSIVASFKNDADSDAIIAINESDDVGTLLVELEDYNKIKNYEDTL